MNRNEAFKVMQQGGYVTHPALVAANAGPLHMVGDNIYDRHSQRITSKWETETNSHYFNDGWVECDEKGNI